MKEFLTAAQEAQQPDDDPGVLEFKVDGELCKAYRPGDGQLAVLMATTTSHASTEEQIAGIINFFASTLDDDSHSFIVSKLLNRRDPFGINEVQGIMEWMVEEWSGRPTRSRRDSTPSPPPAGPNSTPPTPALTS